MRAYRASKIDANQPAIVEALERVGALVWYIEKPFDLLVRYGRAWHVLEVKNKLGKNQHTPQQIIDMKRLAASEGVQNAVRTVYTPEDALRAVGATK